MLTITVRQGDCLELMAQVADASINLILCDLPYGITQNKWDKIIPFDKLWAEYKRILAKNGVIALHCQQPFTTQLISSNYDMFRYCWYWHKNMPTGFLNANRRPMSNVEEIAIFTSGQGLYQPQFIEGKAHIRGHKSNYHSSNYGNFEREQGLEHTEYYPTQVLNIPVEVDRNGHPTQKPVALEEYFIKTYCKEAFTVMDNCMGSGTTGVAAMNCECNFIGFELSSEYYNTAVNRMKNSLFCSLYDFI